MKGLTAVQVGVVRREIAPAPGPAVSILPREYTHVFTLAGEQWLLGRMSIVKVSGVKVSGRPFDRALRVVTTTAPRCEPNLQITAPTSAPVKAGDVLLARFWLRCEESMSGEGLATFVFAPLNRELPTEVEFRVGAASEWREVHVPFRARHDHPCGEACVCFRLGFDRQTVDIGGIEVLNFGSGARVEHFPKTVITYDGRESDASWRRDAEARIEQHRKGDVIVRVTDGAGRPVPGARVRMTLRRHAFGFGSAVTVEHLLGTSADCDRYRDFVQRYFNTAVFENDMKWPENYEALNPRVDAALDWLLERGFRVRGHNLIWPSWKWLPEPLRQYASDPAELRRRTYERVTQAVSRYRGKLVHWDVVNEPYSEHDLMDVLGNTVMLEWFKLAKQADPNCRMYLNDYGIFDGGPDSSHRKYFYEAIEVLKNLGAPLEGIGIQSHFSALPAPPTRILSVLDQFSELGLPIESTELSLNMPDRALQADFMRDYLIALFSHPNVGGVMLWGFWEGRHWRPDAALFEKDWTPRPVAQAWIDLVHKEWKTDIQVTADERGVARARGFCGDYDVLVSHGGTSTAATARLEHCGAQLNVVIAAGASVGAR